VAEIEYERLPLFCHACIMVGHYFSIYKKHNIDKLSTTVQKKSLHNVSKTGQVYVTKQSNVTLSK